MAPPHQPASQPPSSATLYRVTVDRVRTSKKDYPYELQLYVGLQRTVASSASSSSSTAAAAASSGIICSATTFLPFPLWSRSITTSSSSSGTSSAAPLWWCDQECSIRVEKGQVVNWVIDEDCRNKDYVEVHPLPQSSSRRLHATTDRSLEFQLTKVKTGAPQPPAAAGSKKLTAPASIIPEQTYHDRAVLKDSVDDARVTLSFGDTATIEVLLERVSDAEAAVLRAQRGVAAAPLGAALPSSSPDATETKAIVTLADAAAAMQQRSKDVVEGSRVQRFLSEWGGALGCVGDRLAPLVEALPFGELLVKAAAGLFAAVLGRGAVLELGMDICGQTALVLRVLAQPLVRDLILADISTHTLLEKLVKVMEETVQLLQEYTRRGVVRQLLTASGRLVALQQQSEEIQNIFTVLHQLTSFRAQAEHANDLRKVLEIIDTTKLLTASNLSELMLPQLLDRLDSSSSRVDAAIRAAGSDTATAIRTLRAEFTKDVGSIASRLLEQQAQTFEATSNATLQSAVTLMTNHIDTIVAASSRTTVSVMTSTMRALLDEAMHNVLPDALRQLIDDTLSDHLRDVVGGAWTTALQKQLTEATNQVQAQTQQTVATAQVQITAGITDLGKRLEAAAEATNSSILSLERSLLAGLDAGLRNVQATVRNEADALRKQVDHAQLSVLDRIGVLNSGISDVTSELFMQRRLLWEANKKLDVYFDADGKRLADITDILTVIPENVRQSLAPEMMKIQQQLRFHESRSKSFLKVELENAIQNICSTFLSTERLQKKLHEDMKHHINMSNEAMKQWFVDNLASILPPHDATPQRPQQQRASISSYDPNMLLYSLQEDRACLAHLTSEQARCFADYPLQLLQVELRCLYHELYAKETSAVSDKVQLDRMDLYTSLRIVHAPSAATYRGAATDNFEGASMESTEVLVTMETNGSRSLLVEGRAGIGKTTWAVHLAQLQNYVEGVIILVKLSDVAQYLEGKISKTSSTGASVGKASLSTRELLHVSFGKDPAHSNLIDQIFYRLRLGKGRIAWLVDGLDEVISNQNLILKELIDAIEYVAISNAPQDATDASCSSGGSPAQSPKTPHTPKSADMFCAKDFVVVTSREERGGALSNASVVATINPWTEAEAVGYIRNFFKQPSVHHSIVNNGNKIEVCLERAISAIRERRFGSFSTLPLVLEMLCWATSEEATKARIDSITSLYQGTIALKLKVARAKYGAAWTSTYEEICSLCRKKSLEATREGVFFTIDRTQPSGRDLFVSGLVRERFGNLEGSTVVRFVHKSFLEYFQALYFSSSLKDLPTTLWACPIPMTMRDDRPIESVLYTSPEDVVRVMSAEVDVMVEMQLETPRHSNTTIEVVWLEGEGERAKYVSAHEGTFSTRYTPRNDVTCNWNLRDGVVKRIPKVQLMKGKEYFLVLRPSSGISILPVECKWSIATTSRPPRSLSLSQQLPLCDIPGRRQQRNFFQFLTDSVKGDPKKSKALLDFLMGRLEYHHPRVASFMGSTDRSLTSPLQPTGALVGAESTGRSKAHSLAEMGLSIVTECASILLGAQHEEFGYRLSFVMEGSSRFGRFTEALGMKSKAICEWALLPCAAHGTLAMWRGLEKYIPEERKKILKAEGSVLREALVTALVSDRRDIATELTGRGVVLDLPLACRLGATEVVLRELRSVIVKESPDGSDTVAIAVDNILLLSLVECLRSGQLDTASAIWEELAALPYPTPNVSGYILSHFTSNNDNTTTSHKAPRVSSHFDAANNRNATTTTTQDISTDAKPSSDSGALGKNDRLSLSSLTWLRSRISSLAEKSSFRRRLENHAVRTFPVRGMQSAISSQLVTLSGLLESSTPYLAFDENIEALVSLRTAPTRQEAYQSVFVHFRSMTPSLLTHMQQRMNLTSARVVTLCDGGHDAAHREIMTSVLSSTNTTLEELSLVRCQLHNDDASSLSSPSAVPLIFAFPPKLRKLSLLEHCVISETVAGSVALAPHLEELTIDGRGLLRQHAASIHSLLDSIRAKALTSLCITDAVSVHPEHVMSNPNLLAHLTSFTFTNSPLLCDDNLGRLPASITHLNISGCPLVTDKGVCYVSVIMPHLMLLNVAGCTGVTNEGLKALSATLGSVLTSLDVSDCVLITDVGLRTHLSGLRALQSLGLAGCDAITTAGLTESLSCLTALTSLNVAGCKNVTDTALEFLAKLHGSKLKSLDASKCPRMTDDGIVQLAEHCGASLQCLRVEDCPFITLKGFYHIVASCHVLSELKVTGCRAAKDVLSSQTSSKATHLSRGVTTEHKNINSINSSVTSLSLLGGTDDAKNKVLRQLMSSPCLTAIDISDCNSHELEDGTALQFLLSSQRAMLRTLRASGCTHLDDVALSIVSQLHGLTTLDLGRCTNITDTTLRRISGLQALTHLDLAECFRITDDGLAFLKPLRSLTFLDLGGCRNINNAGAEHLTSLTALRSLTVARCVKLTDGGLARIASLHSLATLNLTGCTNIGYNGLTRVAELRALTSLNLTWCSGVTDRSLARLSSLEASLTSLNLSGCGKITNDGLEHLIRMQELLSLNISGCSQVTDYGMEHIASLSSLTSLNASKVWLTSHGLVYIAKLTQLKSLNLSECNRITNDGIQHLGSALRGLRSLQLGGLCNITDAGLAPLAALPALTELNASGCVKLSDKGLGYVAQMQSLTTLNITDCVKVTGAGLSSLSTLPRVSVVNIARCTGIVGDGWLDADKVTILR